MNTRTLQQLIVSSKTRFLNKELHDRDFSLSFVNGKASVLCGARRSGKTTYIRKFIQKLIVDGVNPDRICYLHFFDDVFKDDDVRVSQIVDAYYGLYPQYFNSDNIYFILDEVEMLKSWGAGLSALLDEHSVKVLITGSSGKMLSHDIATELRGRDLQYSFYPLSFNEFLNFNNIDLTITGPVLSKKDDSLLRKGFSLFLERGSFPEVAVIDDSELREKILSSYFDVMYSRDIMERYEVGKAAPLRAFMRRIFRTSGQPQMMGKIENTMKSSGYPLSRPTITEYLEMMKDAAIISEVPIFATERKASMYPKKYYAVDHAFASIFTPFSPVTGVKIEHTVHAKLLRDGKKIFYYRSKDDYEADFLLADEDMNPLAVYQVTDDFNVSRDREIRGVQACMEELGLKEGYILVSEGYEDIKAGNAVIHVRPVREFLIGLA